MQMPVITWASALWVEQSPRAPSALGCPSGIAARNTLNPRRCCADRACEVSGIGGEVGQTFIDIAPVEDYGKRRTNLT